MADLQTLESALVAADRAGDAKSARVLAAEIMRVRSTPDAIDQSAIDAQKPSGTERMGRGMMDLYQGIKQLGLNVSGSDEADAYTKQVSEEIKQYERGRGKDAGVDWLRIGGNIATPVSLIPGGTGATFGTRLATGGLSGAAQSGLMFTPEGDSKAAQMAVGEIGGALAPALVEGVTRGGRALVNAAGNKAQEIGQRMTNNAAPNIDLQLQAITRNAGVDWGNLTNGVRGGLRAEAARQLQTGGGLNTEALERIARAQSLDPRLQLTRGQATRSPLDWQTEQNLRSVQGVGDPLRQRFGEQGQILTENAERMNRGADPYAASEQAIRAIQSKFEETGDAVSALYTAARNTVGAQANVPLDPLRRRAMQTLNEFEDVIPGPIRSRLEALGVGRMDATKPTRAFTVEEAEALDKLINKRWDAANRPLTAALTDLKGAIKDSLNAIDETAGTEAAQAFRVAKRAASERFDEFGQRIASAAVDDVAPDKFVRKFVINADARDIQALTRSLTTGTPEQVARGQQALTELRRSTVTDLFEKNGVIKDGAFSGAKLDKALRDLGPQRMAAIFTPDQVQQLNLLRRVSLDLTQPPPMADINYSRTTSALANLMQSIGELPIIGKLASGTAGKITDLIVSGQQRQAVQQAIGGSAATARAPLEMITRESQNALAGRAAPYALTPLNSLLYQGRQ